jgi:hypothetical protein
MQSPTDVPRHASGETNASPVHLAVVQDRSTRRLARCGHHHPSWAAVHPSPRTLEDPIPSIPDHPETRSLLAGRWRKVTTDAALDQYPAFLTFAEDTYLGARGEGQMMIWWDAGIYRVTDPLTLVLSTATDELVTYRMQLRDAHLAIEVPDRGTVEYERMAGATPV